MADRGELTVYRDCTPVADEQHDVDGDETIVETLAAALAAAEGVDATDIPPLYDVVDPDALRRLFEPGEGTTDGDSVFAFAFDDWNVFVRGDGRVRVCDATRPADPAPAFAGSPVRV